jgi:hypothetical protein
MDSSVCDLIISNDLYNVDNPSDSDSDDDECNDCDTPLDKL